MSFITKCEKWLKIDETNNSNNNYISYKTWHKEQTTTISEKTSIPWFTSKENTSLNSLFLTTRSQMSFPQNACNAADAPKTQLASKNFFSLLYIMAHLITLIAICITYLLPSTTKSQSPASCYSYGCGYYGSSQDCQCNRACENFGDCCSDFNTLCKHGNFEECPAAPIIKQDRRTNKNILRFVSFNIEWLFLNYSHSMGGNFCPGNGCDWRNTPEAYIHLNTVAQYLDEFDADIIMLQETCDCWTIQQLINVMPINGRYYKPYLLRGKYQCYFFNLYTKLYMTLF